MNTKKRSNFLLGAIVLTVAALFLISVGAEAREQKVGKFGKSTISKVQQELKALGYYKGGLSGNLSEETSAAVKAFQKDHKLKVDGIPGKKTRNAISQAVKEQKKAGAKEEKAPAKTE